MNCILIIMIDVSMHVIKFYRTTHQKKKVLVKTGESQNKVWSLVHSITPISMLLSWFDDCIAVTQDTITEGSLKRVMWELFTLFFSIFICLKLFLNFKNKWQLKMHIKHILPFSHHFIFFNYIWHSILWPVWYHK